MKKILIALAVILGLFIITIIAAPIIFKDDIQQAIDQAMDDNLNAKVYYDPDQFSLSLISNFPDFTVAIGDFGIVGIEQFAKDTLVSVSSFEITVDLMSAISGDQIKINEVLLEEPSISVLVLADGSANYDIAKASESAEVVEESSDESSSAMSIGIERWAITNGQLKYLDESMSFFTILDGLNHEGSGDLTLDVFEMNTTTNIAAVSLGYEGEEYLSNKTLAADVNMNMDLGAMKFSFMDNRIALNDFAMAAEGFISMPGDDIEMDISFGGKDISLKSILSLIPGAYQEYLDGVTATGEIGFDGIVKGTFNETSMPKVGASLAVNNGNISYADYPVPMEEININASFDYPSADLTETSFSVDKFHMLIDGEELFAFLKFKDLEDFTWDFGFEGNADLEKITKIVPLEGMTLKGKINSTLNTSGKMSYVDAERYDLLPTSGSMSIDGFSFKTEEYPEFGIQSANLSFNPSEITLSKFNATAGKSDMSLKGKLTNYLAFALNEDEVLLGSLDFDSKLLDLNEWMPEGEVTEDTTSVEDTTALEVVRIPTTIDFTLQSNIDQIAFSDMSLENFKGKVLVKDGAVVLDENSFNMLDGTFELAGSYQTKEETPKYDFKFAIKELSIGSAFGTFTTLQQYVPIAQQMTGKFSTDFTVEGTLGQDMMPIMDEMNLSGLVNIAEAALKGGDFLNKVSAVTSLKGGGSASEESKGISVKDVLVSAAIKQGRLFIEPFDLNIDGQKATLGGSNSLTGNLDYAMLMKEVPTGALGSAVSSVLNSLSGGNSVNLDKVDLNLGIVGSFTDPQVKLLSTSPSSGGQASSAKAAFENQVNAKVEEEKAKAEAEIARQKAEAEAKAKAVADSTKAALEAKKKAAEEAAKKKIEEEKKKATDAAKDKVKDLFKKKGGGK